MANLPPPPICKFQTHPNVKEISRKPGDRKDGEDFSWDRKAETLTRRINKRITEMGIQSQKPAFLNSPLLFLIFFYYSFSSHGQQHRFTGGLKNDCSKNVQNLLIQTFKSHCYVLSSCV